MEESMMSSDSYAQYDSSDVKAGRWTTEEHNLFLQGLKKYNKQWKQIAELVKTRTVVQIRTHAQKYFQKMEKMKDGKCTKPSTLVALESIMMDVDEVKSSSRTSSISSADSLESGGMTMSEGDSDSEPMSNDAYAYDEYMRPEIVDSPRKRGREKRSSLTRSSRSVKRNRYEFHGSLDSSSFDSSCDLFHFGEDEGQTLDESIVVLLEKIDWSLPLSRSHSPFMNSAASVSSGLDSFGAAEPFPILDFNETAEPPLSSDAVVNKVSPVQIVHNVRPGVQFSEREAYSNVMKEFLNVFGGYQTGAYDRLPSIRALTSMTSSNFSISYTGNLTPSHSTFCHYPLADSPNMFEDGPLNHLAPIAQDDRLGKFDFDTQFSANLMADIDTLHPTPRKRGRPRKLASVPSITDHC